MMSIIALSACRTDEQKGDVLSGTDVKVFRYDRLQYEATAMNSVSALRKMNTDYPRATRILVEEVLMLGRVNDPAIDERLCAYYSDTTLLRLMSDALEHFKDMSSIEKGLSEGFKKLKQEVPSLIIPRVYSQISALNQSVVVGDSLLGISLDKYMGADYPLYRRYYYPYQRRSMSPDRILTDCFTFYLMSQYPFPWTPGHRTLFDVIMHHGKINWVVRQILGMKSDEELMGYDKTETAWCRKHRKGLWEWTLEQGYFSSTDPMIIRAYTRPDPSIIFKGETIPPSVGTWLGMQLIDMYMKQHPGTGIRQLLERSDFNDLRDIKF